MGSVKALSFDRGDPVELYRTVAALVVPRPIAWISTRSASGLDNLAPHSFFSIASTRPTIVQFAVTGNASSHTALNVRATGEFVVNLASRSLVNPVSVSAVPFERARSEFDEAGVTREASAAVGPPRVAESPASLECVLVHEVAIGDAAIFFGEVVHAAVAVAAMNDRGPDAHALDPVSRLGRDEWSTLGTVLRVPRLTRPDRP